MSLEDIQLREKADTYKRLVQEVEQDLAKAKKCIYLSAVFASLCISLSRINDFEGDILREVHNLGLNNEFNYILDICDFREKIIREYRNLMRKL